MNDFYWKCVIIGIILGLIINIHALVDEVESHCNKKYCYELSIEKGISYDECMEVVDK